MMFKLGSKQLKISRVLALALTISTAISLGGNLLTTKSYATEAAVSDNTIKPIETNWEKISEDDGVTVWRQEIKGTPVFAFRGETMIDASVAKIMTVMRDTSRKKEWVADLGEARDVKQISTEERIEYNHTKTPFPLTDRDFVFLGKVSMNRAEKQMVVDIKSVEDASVPVYKGKVRGKLYASRYVFTALEGGKRTKTQVEILVDPMGSVPKWMVNMVQKSWPKKTLNGIKKQVAKTDVIADPDVEKAFQGL